MAQRKRATPKQIELTERRAAALELRKQGGSYREIAETMRNEGKAPETYDYTLAWKDVTDELRRLNEENGASVEEMRQLQLEQLNALWTKQYDLALEGDGWALDRCLAIQGRIGALFGLSAPVKTEDKNELTGPNGQPLQTGSQVTIYIPNNGRGDNHPPAV